MDFNEIHFKKAHQWEIRNDKICTKLDSNEIYNKTLNGELNYEDYSSKNAEKFLRLLKILAGSRYLYPSRSHKIITEEWTRNIIQAKRIVHYQFSQNEYT